MREQTRMFELETETAELKQRVQELGDQLNSAMCQVEKLARENGKLEAMAAAMKLLVRDDLMPRYTELFSVAGLGRECVMTELAQRALNGIAGDKLVQKIHQLEKVVEAARNLTDKHLYICPIPKFADDLRLALAELKKVRGE